MDHRQSCEIEREQDLHRLIDEIPIPVDDTQSSMSSDLAYEQSVYDAERPSFSKHTFSPGNRGEDYFENSINSTINVISSPQQELNIEETESEEPSNAGAFTPQQVSKMMDWSKAYITPADGIFPKVSAPSMSIDIDDNIINASPPDTPRQDAFQTPIPHPYTNVTKKESIQASPAIGPSPQRTSSMRESLTFSPSSTSDSKSWFHMPGMLASKRSHGQGRLNNQRSSASSDIVNQGSTVFARATEQPSIGMSREESKINNSRIERGHRSFSREQPSYIQNYEKENMQDVISENDQLREHLKLLKAKHRDGSQLDKLRGRQLENACAERDALKSECERKENKIQRLKKDLSIALTGDVGTEKDEEIDRMNLELTRSNIKIKSLNEKIQDLAAFNEQLKQDISNLEAEGGNASKHIYQLEEQLTESHKKLELRSKEIEKLQSAVGDQEETISKFSEKKAEMAEDMNKARAKIANLEVELDAYKQEHNPSSNSNYSEQINSVKEQYETRLAQTKEELLEYKNKVKALESKVKGLTAEGVKLKDLVDSSNLEHYQRENEEIRQKQENDSENIDQLNEQVAKLIKQLNSSKSTVRQWETRHEDVVAENDELAAEIRKLEDAKLTHNKTTRKLESCISEQKDEIRQLANEIKKLQNSSESDELSAEIRKLEDEKLTHNKTQRQLESKIAEQDDKIRSLSSEIKKVQTNRDLADEVAQGYRIQLDQISKPEIDKALMTSFDVSVNRSTSQLSSVVKDPCRIESKDIMDLLEEKEREFEKEKSAYEDKMMSLENEICRLNSDNMNANRKISKLEMKLSSLTDKFSSETQTSFREEEKQRDRVESELFEQKVKLQEEFNARLSKMATEHENKNQSLEKNYNSNIESLENDFKKKVKTLEVDYTQALDQTRQENEAMISERQEEMEAALDERDKHHQEKLKDYNSTINKLQKQIDILNREVSDKQPDSHVNELEQLFETKQRELEEKSNEYINEMGQKHLTELESLNCTHMERLRSALDEANQEFDKTKTDTINRYETDLKSQESKYQKQISDLEEEYSRKIEDIDRTSKEIIAQLKSLHERELAALQNEKSTAVKSNDEKMQAKLDKMKKKFDSQLAGERDKQSEIQSNTQRDRDELMTIIKGKEDNYRKQLETQENKLKQKLKKQLEQKESELETRLTAVKEAAELDTEQRLSALRKEFVETSDKQKKEFKEKDEKLKAAHRRQKAEWDREQRKLKEAVEQAMDKARLDLETSEMEKLNNERKSNDRKLMQKKKLLEHKLQKELSDQKQSMEQQFEKEKFKLTKELQEEHRSSLKQREEHITAIQKQKAEHDLQIKLFEKETAIRSEMQDNQITEIREIEIKHMKQQEEMRAKFDKKLKSEVEEYRQRLESTSFMELPVKGNTMPKNLNLKISSRASGLGDSILTIDDFRNRESLCGDEDSMNQVLQFSNRMNMIIEDLRMGQLMQEEKRARQARHAQKQTSDRTSKNISKRIESARWTERQAIADFLTREFESYTKNKTHSPPKRGHEHDYAELSQIIEYYVESLKKVWSEDFETQIANQNKITAKYRSKVSKLEDAMKSRKSPTAEMSANFDEDFFMKQNGAVYARLEVILSDLTSVSETFENAFSYFSRTQGHQSSARKTTRPVSHSKENSIRSEYRTMLNALRKYANDTIWIVKEQSDDTADTSLRSKTPKNNSNRVEVELERVRNEYKSYIERTNEGIAELTTDNTNLNTANQELRTKTYKLEQFYRDSQERAMMYEQEVKGGLSPELLSPDETCDLVLQIFKRSNKESILTQMLSRNPEFVSLVQEFVDSVMDCTAEMSAHSPVSQNLTFIQNQPPQSSLEQVLDRKTKFNLPLHYLEPSYSEGISGAMSTKSFAVTRPRSAADPGLPPAPHMTRSNSAAAFRRQQNSTQITPKFAERDGLKMYLHRQQVSEFDPMQTY